MRALTISFLLVLAIQAGAECGNLCNDEWWKTATISNVKDELDAGVDVMSRNADGFTPLHSASIHGANESIQALLDVDCWTLWDYAQEIEKLKDTKAYLALNDAQYD